MDKSEVLGVLLVDEEDVGLVDKKDVVLLDKENVVLLVKEDVVLLDKEDVVSKESEVVVEGMEGVEIRNNFVFLFTNKSYQDKIILFRIYNLN